MQRARPSIDWRQVMQHPLLKKIAGCAAQTSDSAFLVIYPTLDGWGQASLSGKSKPLPDFCRAIHSSPEGARQCKLCHILMAVSACSGHSPVQHCHAGARVMVCPASPNVTETLAVVSSCQFYDESAWPEAEEHARKLGLNIEAVRKAYFQLPPLSPERQAMMECAMDAMRMAIETIYENVNLRRSLQTSAADSGTSLEDVLRNIAPSATNSSAPYPKTMPLVLQVICELIQQRPDLPLTVKQLSDAARMTPNYFSSLFHEHMGQTFSDFLAETRLRHAEELLMDPTLNISDVARVVGYEDPGYFARRFRKHYGISPREWRIRQAHAPTGNGS